MASHHFLGTGLVSPALATLSGQVEELLGEVGRRVARSGLKVMARQAVPFPDGGLTLVWVLAESHLVLHLWSAEGYATIDLHVCDYRQSNAAAARRLVDSLRRLCFTEGSDRWHERRIEPPRWATPGAGAAAATACPSIAPD